MTLIVDIRQYFTAARISRYLQHLPELKTTIMDDVFGDRLQWDYAVIPLDEVMTATGVLPVVKRGAPGTPLTDQSRAITYIEPLPIKPVTSLSGVELNNYKLLGATSKEEWAQRKTDNMRRVVRRTTEALCAQALMGTISHPLKTESGMDEYQIDYGSPHMITPDVLWDAATAKARHVYEVLINMRSQIRNAGWGGKIKTYAGPQAYMALLSLLDTPTPAEKIKMMVVEGGIMVGGEFLVALMDDAYPYPGTPGITVSIVASDEIVMVGLESGHKLFYAALDDLDSNLQALPIFIKPEMINGELMLRGESKPLPAPNMKAISRAVVVSD